MIKLKSTHITLIIMLTSISLFFACGGDGGGVGGPNIEVDVSNMSEGSKDAARKCLEAVKDSLPAIAKKIGVDLDGVNIKVRLDPLDGDGAGETKPDLSKSDDKSFIIKIHPRVCELVGTETFVRIIAHELIHIKQFTRDPSPLLEKFKERERTSKEDQEASRNGDPDKKEKKKKALEAEKEYEEEQKKAEEEAYDSAEDQKDALGLSEGELKLNEETKEKVLKAAEEKIKHLEKLIDNF